jgi:hypothetical protein
MSLTSNEAQNQASGSCWQLLAGLCSITYMYTVSHLHDYDDQQQPTRLIICDERVLAVLFMHTIAIHTGLRLGLCAVNGPLFGQMRNAAATFGMSPFDSPSFFIFQPLADLGTLDKRTQSLQTPLLR